jgi:glycosyltransferase involved in cell wall biosynthesis
VPRVLLAFEPPDGGVAENVGQLAGGLGAHGWDVALAGPQDALPYADVEPRGTPIHRLPFRRGYGNPAADAAALRGLLALLSDDPPDLLHCHSAKAGVLGRIAARATGTPVVYTPHCFPFIGEFGTPRRLFATNVERFLGRLGGDIICVCEDERRVGLAAKVAPPGALHVVHNGCGPCPGADPDAALAALREQGPTAAAIAVLREQKSLHVLIDAVPIVLAKVPTARIAIVGDGPLRDQLHAHAARLGLDTDERFAFLPFQAPSARALRALDVYVLPSSWEAFPIGVLEALACGVPQVATDVGGTGEAVTPETGRLVPPHDPPALAEALAELLADEAKRAAMGEASRARHAERFGIERMVAATAEVYAKALTRSRRS